MLIWIFCIIVIVIIPIIGLIAFVYIVLGDTNAPIGGWKIESKLHRFECDICPTPKNCRQCKRYRNSIKSSLIRRW